VRGSAFLIVLGLALSGCFGDWVTANQRPRREASGPAPAPAPVVLEVPADACLRYQAATRDLCHDLLTGTAGAVRCYTEVLKISGKPAISDEPREEGHASPRARSCASELAQLEKRRGPTRTVTLGPQCQAWAVMLEDACLRPLEREPAVMPVECGGWLMAFESALEGRGRGEESCERMRESAALHTRG
jgi:hypothetical protein